MKKKTKRKKKEELKKEYFAGYGEMIWSLICVIYAIWYVWFYFIESNPALIGIKGVAAAIVFWLAIVTIVVNIISFSDGPQFLSKKKFELIDIFTIIGTTLLLYGIFAYVAWDLLWLFR